MRVYVASSWRNSILPEVVVKLRDVGHEVYGDETFHWDAIDPEWRWWDAAHFREALGHPIACLGFGKDMRALDDCDACVLVLPCDQSAHLELGYAAGIRKITAVLLAEYNEPELMYKMNGRLCVSIEEMIDYLKRCCIVVSRKTDK